MTVPLWETRQQWGAAPARGVRTDVTPRGVSLHWPGPGSFAGQSHGRCREVMRSWQAMHMARGSLDLEYGLVVCPHLRVMEGRTVKGRPLTRVGSNGTAAANTTHTSVQLMRGASDGPPTVAELRVLGWVVGWFRDGGWGPAVTGHRDHFATSCPGPALYAALPRVKKFADEYEEEPVRLSDEDVSRIAEAVWDVQTVDPLKPDDPPISMGALLRRVRRLLGRRAGL